MRESVISLSLVEMHAPLSPSLTSKNRNESIDAHAFSALIPSLEHIKSELPCVQDYLAHCVIENIYLNISSSWLQEKMSATLLLLWPIYKIFRGCLCSILPTEKTRIHQWRRTYSLTFCLNLMKKPKQKWVGPQTFCAKNIRNLCSPYCSW